MKKFLSYVIDFYRCVLRLAACRMQADAVALTVHKDLWDPLHVCRRLDTNQLLNKVGTVF